jgi:hypothetical protein
MSVAVSIRHGRRLGEIMATVWTSARLWGKRRRQYRFRPGERIPARRSVFGKARRNLAYLMEYPLKQHGLLMITAVFF